MNGPVSLPSRLVGGKTAEPYQVRIMTDSREAIRIGRSGAILAPTGSGKSLMAAALVEDAIDLRIPILVLHPDISLLRQNFAQFRQLEGFEKAKVGAFIAKNETLDPCPFIRDTFDVDLILASNMSIVNKLDNAVFRKQLAAFGQRKGVVLIDEGHKAGADRLSEALEIISEAGGCGIVLTATPFRTDGVDPLDAFGASVEKDLIGIAEYNEVLKTGRIVRTKFDIAATEFEKEIGEEAIDLIDQSFKALLKENKSIDQASSQALGHFFKATASDAEKLIANLIVMALVKIWRRRAADKKLTMLHCDSVALAERLAQMLAQTTLPNGHTRAHEKPNVAFIIANDMKIWSEGLALDITAELGWKKGEWREKMLAQARAGKLDILVNVSTLGTGTDVPSTDLNIIVAKERSLSPSKQIAGRGERQDPKNPDKTHQVFVDIGSSIINIFKDVDAMRHNAPERSRRHIRGLNADIRKQFEQWFDADPTLQAQIHKRMEILSARAAPSESIEEIADPADPSMTMTTVAEPFPFAPGILAAGLSRPDWSQRDPISGKPKMLARVALFCDLKNHDLFANPLSDLPQWLALVHDQRTKGSHAFLCADLSSALNFAAFMGINGSMNIETYVAKSDGAADYENTDPVGRDIPSPPTPPQLGLLQILDRKAKGRPWPSAFMTPKTKNDASVAITLRSSDLMKELFEEGAKRMSRGALKDAEIQHPLRAVFLDQPDRIPAHKKQMLAAYDVLMRRGLQSAAEPSAWPFSIVTFDHGALPDTLRTFHGNGTKYVVLDGSHDESKAQGMIKEGLVFGRISAVGPDGVAENWLRQKAGLKISTEASRERETRLEDLMRQVGKVEHGAIELILTPAQYKDIGKANKGWHAAAPMAALAACLIGLSDAQAAKTLADDLTTALVEKPPELALRAAVKGIKIAFAGQSAVQQKDVLKVLERAAKFLLQAKEVKIEQAKAKVEA